MSKKSFARLIHIVTGVFGAARDEFFSFEASHTRFEKFVHFWVLVWGSFRRNRCPVRASALSFTTLLALIPMLAVAMSVTTMFLKSEGQEQIESFIERFVEQMVPSLIVETNKSPEAAAESSDTNAASAVQPGNDLSQTNAPALLIRDERVVAAQKKAAGYIHQFIQNAYSGRIGVVGVVFLLWTAIVMLTRVEETFNDIWGVTRGRNWLSRVVLYWATITLGPLLLVGALGLASGSHFQKTRALITVVPFLEPVFSQLLPVLVITITFALFYKLMPNTKVHFGAALVGGALAGTAWHLFNVFSLYVGSRAVNASKIYGSLALVPLLMLGLYTVWVIVLFGAQVAYAFPESRIVFAGKAGRKREPARARVRGVALDDVHRTAVPSRPAAAHGAGDVPRTRHPEQARAAGVADVARRAARRGNLRRGERLFPGAPARRDQRPSHSARHARHAGARIGHAR